MEETNRKKLLEAIYEGLLNVKGEEIVSLDLRKVDGAVCKYFIICGATSTTQVKGLADSVDKEVKEKTGERVWRKEGFDNMTWVILDYADVVVHIFQEEARKFYQLEELWADAKLTKIED
ncbi:MAG: ribosome silencing factor [Bacteroidales bacterium]|nr:ribosome silencing factor [Bacteroidales bacterium]